MRILAEMQAASLRVAALEAEVTALPKRLQAAEADVKSAQSLLDSCRSAIKSEEGKRRRLESDIVDLRAKAAKYRAQTNTVTTTEQLKALEHEVEFLEQRISEAETMEIESMEATEKLESECVTRESGVAAAKKLQAEAQAYVRAKSQELHTAVAAARSERDGFRAKAEPEWLNRFDTIARTRRTGVAEVIDGECQACHMRLRPHQWNQVRGGEAFKCESCGRMLYYDEGNDRQLAAKAAGHWNTP